MQKPDPRTVLSSCIDGLKASPTSSGSLSPNATPIFPENADFFRELNLNRALAAFRQKAVERVVAERDALRAALEALVKKYVANLGSKDDEFICCITPPSARQLTKAERSKDSTWSLWDNARAAIQKAGAK